MATINENIDKIRELLRSSSELTGQEREEAIRWLDNAQMHFNAKRWNESKILEACKNYVCAYGHISSDSFEKINKAGALPSRATLERVFNMKSAEFCRMYFPTKEEYRNAYDYFDMPVEEVNRIFKEEYLRVKAMTLREYDTRRRKWKPTGGVVMRCNGLTWAELRKLLSLPGRRCGRKRHPHNSKFEVVIWDV